MKKGIYEENGVKLSKQSCKMGDMVELVYTGLLRNSGATALKAHIGYNEGWEEAQTIEMELKDDAFTVNLALAKAGTLNCAFVDPLGNWDNNSGENYSFKVAKAPASKKPVASKKAPTAKSETEKKTTSKKTATKAKKASETKESELKKAKKEAAPAMKTDKTKVTSAAKKTVKTAKEKK